LSIIDDPLLERLYRQANASRWSVPANAFRDSLQAVAERVFAAGSPSRRELERYLGGLHLADLALACACAAGDERAWEHFISEQRPILYRAADALDRSGGAREIADSLYADLYGVRGDSETRASLFRYFHGRSSLSTWLRAVLAQRYVDRVRVERRTSPLDEEEAAAIPATNPEPESERARFAALVARALRAAVARLDARDRLRLRAYYEQDLTLAQVGRITGEHEATVSRQITKARKALRSDVEEQLRAESRLSAAEIASGLSSVMDDPGSLDLRELFGSNPEPQDPRARSF
jgi:RNA polymerase sigma-70 factor, ECF subfamily